MVSVLSGGWVPIALQLHSGSGHLSSCHTGRCWIHSPMHDYDEFTKLLLALSSFAQPFDRMISIQKHYFIILNHRQACAGRSREETSGKRRGPVAKMAAPKVSVHPVRNRLCYHFFVYQTNECCSRIVSRRLMLLRSLNKSCFRVTAPNATEALFCT